MSRHQPASVNIMFSNGFFSDAVRPNLFIFLIYIAMKFASAYVLLFWSDKNSGCYGNIYFQ